MLDLDSATEHVCNSTEGRDLIRTLERVIGVIIEVQGNNIGIHEKGEPIIASMTWAQLTQYYELEIASLPADISAHKLDCECTDCSEDRVSSLYTTPTPIIDNVTSVTELTNTPFVPANQLQTSIHSRTSNSHTAQLNSCQIMYI